MKGKKIILGVTGSIAAYKAAYLCRLLRKEGAEVKVILTKAAQKFVTPLTFSNLSQSPVVDGLWSGSWTEHVHLGEWADALLIAPATANTIAKMATGLCEDMLTAVYLSMRNPVLIAPAMDAEMYAHPQTQKNILSLQEQGIQVMEAEEGFLASGIEGRGRMPEPEKILVQLTHILSPQYLKGKKILISAGPTREAIDPVRYFSNGATGKMGYALAKVAQQLGAEVTLVTGPTQLKPPSGCKILKVTTAAEMKKVIDNKARTQDMIIMSAAVADYRPVNFSAEKIKKQGGFLTITMERTDDILFSLGVSKSEHQILVGFALETHNEENFALQKLKKKNLDYIVLNSQREPGAGMGSDTNKITLIDKSEQMRRYPLKSKVEVARDILTAIAKDQYEA